MPCKSDIPLSQAAGNHGGIVMQGVEYVQQLASPLFCDGAHNQASNCRNFRQTPSVQSTPSGNNNMAMIAFRCELSWINLTLICSQLEVKLVPLGAGEKRFELCESGWLTSGQPSHSCHSCQLGLPSSIQYAAATASQLPDPLCQPLRPTYCQPYPPLLPAEASRFK